MVLEFLSEQIVKLRRRVGRDLSDHLDAGILFFKFGDGLVPELRRV